MRVARVPRFLPLASATLMLGIALSFTAPYLSLFGVEQAGMSPLRLGVFMTAIAASGVWASAWAGRRSDRQGRHRPWLLGSLAAAAAGYLCLCFVRDYAALMAVGILLIGPGAASLSQVFSFGRSALPVTDPAQREFAAAALRTLLSAAWVFGPAVGALVLAQTGYIGLFFFAAGSFALCALLVARVAETHGPAHTLPSAGIDADTHHAAPPLQPGTVTAKQAKRDDAPASMGRALAALTLIGLVANATMIMLPLYVVQRLGGTRLDVSTMLGLGALLEIPMMLWLGAKSSRLAKARWLAAAAGIHVAYFVALAACRSVTVAMPLQALSAGVVAITSCLGLTYVQELVPRAPGSATALFFNASRVGSIAAGVLSGFIIETIGYRPAFLLCGLLALCAFALFAVDARGRVLRSR
ncbi:MFS transporter [Trinickia caryophylli]|nr:MFS transporter [Trinickia caryophylli]PMS12820.1 MFS transporter [Trinickia caryophylli]TRX15455.1 MFS transporter [Trinickia caryophylli]WQE15645.1 MFS transporter [Trinickia caryophylli]